MDLSVFSSMLSVNGPKGTRREGKKFRQYAAALSSEYLPHNYYTPLTILFLSLTLLLLLSSLLLSIASFNVLFSSVRCHPLVPDHVQILSYCIALSLQTRPSRWMVGWRVVTGRQTRYLLSTHRDHLTKPPRNLFEYNSVPTFVVTTTRRRRWLCV